MQGNARTIALIEDELSIAQAVAARLRSEGYVVELADDGPSGVELVERIRPDLVVLDLMLPGFDGLEVCRRIQQDQWVPVLMITARDTEADMIIGLGVGADDYMTKPFSARELVARVAALLRRVERTAARTGADGIVAVGEVALDTDERRTRVHGDEVHLTPTEFDLLLYLARQDGRVATREELLVQVWGYDFPAGARTVDSHVRSLRRKLGAEIVRTVHGVGYSVDQRASVEPR
ncbi:MAG TPA: response regulator transcription factor [Acidimicrobiia bacterium]